MAIEICPLAADVGNLADWAAVAVAAVGAAAVFMLSRAANRTADASFRLTQQIEERENALHRREARLLASELLTEVNYQWAEAQKIARYVKLERIVWGGERGVARTIQLLAMPIAERERDRLHLLPDHAAAAVAYAQLRVQQLRNHAHVYMSQHFETPNGDNFLPVVVDSSQLTESALEQAFNALQEALMAEKLHG